MLIPTSAVKTARLMTAWLCERDEVGHASIDRPASERKRDNGTEAGIALSPKRASNGFDVHLAAPDSLKRVASHVLFERLSNGVQAICIRAPRRRLKRGLLDWGQSCSKIACGRIPASRTHVCDRTIQDNLEHVSTSAFAPGFFSNADHRFGYPQTRLGGLSMKASSLWMIASVCFHGRRHRPRRARSAL